MTDNHSHSDLSNLEFKDNIENYEQYLLYNRAAIIQKLRQLGKSRNLITAYFDNGENSLLTVLVEVMPDKDMLVLDYGSDETLNKKMLDADRVVFKTQHLGITAQFTCDNIQKAKFHGNAAFACKLPDSMLWAQRREYYRVRIPLSEEVNCTLINNGQVIEFPVLDISVGGLALHLTSQQPHFELGGIFQNCKLSISASEEGIINLEIRNQLPIKPDDPEAGERFGCAFINLGTDIGSVIQRYIHTTDVLKHRIEV